MFSESYFSRPIILVYVTNKIRHTKVFKKCKGSYFCISKYKSSVVYNRVSLVDLKFKNETLVVPDIWVLNWI